MPYTYKEGQVVRDLTPEGSVTGYYVVTGWTGNRPILVPATPSKRREYYLDVLETSRCPRERAIAGRELMLLG